MKWRSMMWGPPARPILEVLLGAATEIHAKGQVDRRETLHSRSPRTLKVRPHPDVLPNTLPDVVLWGGATCGRHSPLDPTCVAVHFGGQSCHVGLAFWGRRQCPMPMPIGRWGGASPATMRLEPLHHAASSCGTTPQIHARNVPQTTIINLASATTSDACVCPKWTPSYMMRHQSTCLLLPAVVSEGGQVGDAIQVPLPSVQLPDQCLSLVTASGRPLTMHVPVCAGNALLRD